VVAGQTKPVTGVTTTGPAASYDLTTLNAPSGRTVRWHANCRPTI
jgi:hypothetical protein